MLKSLIAATMIMALPVEAFALSCMRPNVENSFKFANKRPEAFIIAYGQLKRVGPNSVQPRKSKDLRQRGTPYRFKAKFRGKVAGHKGFGSTRTLPVTVDVKCSGPWCGGDSLSKSGLYFLRKDSANAYTLEATACSSHFFPKPSKADLKSVIGCFSGGCG